MIRSMSGIPSSQSQEVNLSVPIKQTLTGVSSQEASVALRCCVCAETPAYGCTIIA